MLISNRTFDEIAIGENATLTRTLGIQEIELFAIVSGDVNPVHLNVEFSRTDMFHRIVGHGMWSGALISALLGTKLPGPGTVYVEQTLRFLEPVGVGDTMVVTVTVAEKIEQHQHVILDCRVTNQRGQLLVEGRATVIAPKERISLPSAVLPTIDLRGAGQRYARLVSLTEGMAALRTAVVHPVDPASLGGAIEAARSGLIIPVLVGPRAKMQAVADQAGYHLADFEIVDTEHSEAATVQAVAMARAGKVEALMKGALHTAELMHAVVDRDHGLRTGRRMSHVFAIDAPGYPRPLFITDAALNLNPSLEDKRDIVQNAIDLLHTLGNTEPRVALLSAVETVTPAIRSTLDAAALCKMAERGQISGAILDGPLAFDNAVSAEAAACKGILSSVAGQADILLVPDVEAGNMLAKQLEYLAGAQMAGIVIGARVPIILTSRADPIAARLASCAIALLLARHPASTPP